MVPLAKPMGIGRPSGAMQRREVRGLSCIGSFSRWLLTSKADAGTEGAGPGQSAGRDGVERLDSRSLRSWFGNRRF